MGGLGGGVLMDGWRGGGIVGVGDTGEVRQGGMGV